MTFLHPEYFYTLIPLTLFYIFLLTQKESFEHYFAQEIIDKLKVNSNALTLKARNTLLFIVAALMVIAASEPVLEDGTVRVRATGADILIALDISDSMLAEDVYPNRLELAKKKALQLIKKATKYRVGVIAFAKNSYLVSPVSFDTKTVSFLLSKLDTSSITQRGTDILTMLKTIVKTDTSTEKKYLLILSDGGDETDFSSEIAFANENEVMVFVLGMGTALGTSIKKRDDSLVMYKNEVVISTLNESISELAIQTGGVYIQNSTSSEDIEKMFSEIINNSEHKELKSQDIQSYVALFYYPIILAILILLTAFSSIRRRVKHTVSLPAFILFVLILSASPSVAEMFDFRELADAKSLYEAKDYNSSAKIYEKYAKKTDNAAAYYNAGNAYYKAKEYLRALSAYSFAGFKDKELRAKKLSNMGNAFVHLDTKNTLERAIKHYEVSLKLKEDKPTRENMEAVIKALEEEKEKSKKEEKKEQEKEYTEQKTDAMGKDADEASDTNNKNKNKNPKNKGGSKGKNSEDKANTKNKKKSADGDSKGEDDKSGEGSGGDNSDGVSKEQTKELKDKSKKEIKNRGDGSKSSAKSQGMSDLEEHKWVKKLNSRQNTYLYQLNEETAENKEKNEKNW